jgi:hypothetical protein
MRRYQHLSIHTNSVKTVRERPTVLFEDLQDCAHIERNPSNARPGTLYGSLIPHIQPASVHPQSRMQLMVL